MAQRLFLLVAAARAAAPAPLALDAPLRYAPQLPCPLPASEPVALVNRAIAELLPAGKVEEALACLVDAMAELRSAASAASADVLEAVAQNIAILSEALAPFVSGARRIIHNLDQRPHEWPPMSVPLGAPPARDPAIRVTDGALSAAQCAAVIDLFEASSLYEGNVMSAGRVVVDRAAKSRWEFDISHTHNATGWPAWERVFVGVVVRALVDYDAHNAGLRALKTPLGDEGFRAIRYRAEPGHNGTEHHLWHADGGQEPRGALPRVLAAIIYLNAPARGGETRFLNQALAVKPRCGRVLMFPAAFPYVHAGTPVVEGSKYAIVLQITL